MKISGTATLGAPVETVWAALNDPAVLVRTIPGCQRLEEVTPDVYKMTISVGVASIKGTYEGEVVLADQQPPDSFVLKASGAGAPGTVSADVRVTLSPTGDAGTGTRLDYDADAIVGGVVGGVGQRMLTGVAKRMAGEFFGAVDDVLTGVVPAVEGGPAPVTAGPGSTHVYSAAPAPSAAAGVARSGERWALVAAFGMGAVVAAGGVVLGWLIGRSRGRWV